MRMRLHIFNHKCMYVSMFRSVCVSVYCSCLCQEAAALEKWSDCVSHWMCETKKISFFLSISFSLISLFAKCSVLFQVKLSRSVYPPLPWDTHYRSRFSCKTLLSMIRRRIDICQRYILDKRLWVGRVPPGGGVGRSNAQYLIEATVGNPCASHRATLPLW